MQFQNEIDRILKTNLTDNAYKFWLIVKEQVIPSNIWESLTSTSKKYHQKEGGFVPSIGEHTCEMLRSASKCMSMFDITKKTSECDLIMLGIVLHDCYKKGEFGKSYHNINNHDKLIADKISIAKGKFCKFLSEEQFDILVDMVRFHTGRWSTDAKKDFNFSNHHPYVLFLHTLDMLSSRNCLKLILGDS